MHETPRESGAATERERHLSQSGSRQEASPARGTGFPAVGGVAGVMVGSWGRANASQGRVGRLLCSAERAQKGASQQTSASAVGDSGTIDQSPQEWLTARPSRADISRSYRHMRAPSVVLSAVHSGTRLWAIARQQYGSRLRVLAVHGRVVA